MGGLKRAAFLATSSARCISSPQQLSVDDTAEVFFGSSETGDVELGSHRDRSRPAERDEGRSKRFMRPDDLCGKP